MWVQVSLFKLDIDPSNPWAGQSPAAREAFFETTSEGNPIRIPRAPYNPRESFRVAYNWTQLEEKYNYAVYTFYTNQTGNEGKTVRSYFINDVAYVNDNVSELLVTRDIIGDSIHYLKLQRCYPSQYTYREEIASKLPWASPLKVSNVRTKDYDNEPSETNLAGFITNGTSIDMTREWHFGFLEIIASPSSSASLSYVENGMRYPFGVFYIPFAYSYGSSIEDCKIESETPFTYGEFTLAALSDYKDILQGLQGNYSIIDVHVQLDVWRTVTAQAENIGTVTPGMSIKLNTLLSSSYVQFSTVVIEGKYVIQVTQNNSGNITDYVTLPEFNYGALNRAPYCVFEAWRAGNVQELDPYIFSSLTNNRIYYSISLIPPYSTTFYLGIQARTRLPFVVLQDGGSFVMSSNEYIQWVRDNYNATVTGLAVRQDSERRQFENDVIYGSIAQTTKDLSNVAASAVSGGSTGAATAAIRAAGNLAADAVTNAGNAANLDIKQETERALLDLRIADIKNVPDRVGINGIIYDICQKKAFSRIVRTVSVNIKEVKAYHKAFGYALLSPVTELRSHTKWDYVRVTDIDIIFTSDTDNFYLMSTERKLLKDMLSNGVRIWWTDTPTPVNDYKVFDFSNSEYEETE